MVTGCFDYDKDGGLLKSGNEMRKTLESYKKKMAKENRRAKRNSNRKYAAKAIRRITADYSWTYENALYKYAGGTFMDEVGGEFADWIYSNGENFGEYVVENFVRSK